MEVAVDSIVIKNKKQTMRIYSIDGSDDEFGISFDEDIINDFFSFKKEDAVDIIHAIELVVGDIKIGREVQFKK